VRAEVDVRFAARTVEIFRRGEQIAASAHDRNHRAHDNPGCMASSHRCYAGWTTRRIRQDVATIGPATSAL
jgi:hypothetical protein